MFYKTKLRKVQVGYMGVYLNNTSCYLFLERACLEDDFSSFRNLFSK